MIPTMAQQAASLTEAWRASQVAHDKARNAGAESQRRSREAVETLGMPIREFVFSILSGADPAQGMTQEQITQALAARGVKRDRTVIGKTLRRLERDNLVRRVSQRRNAAWRAR